MITINTKDTKDSKEKQEVLFCLSRNAFLLFFLCVVGVLGVESAVTQAQFQMPDPKQMSGIPRPVDDLPSGSISVRVIRGSLSNNITGQPVELHVGSKVLTVKTDDAGRAQFDKLTAGATVKAVTVVDGERLESQEFPAPEKGGIRLMLVATDTSKGPATTPNAPAISGQVTIADQSRIVFEPDDDGVRMFYLLDVANNARSPVSPPSPFVFDMPSDAENTTLMDGSSPLASVKGRRVTVQGPFPPGHTYVQVGAMMPVGDGEVSIAQTFPAPLEEVAVIVRRRSATRSSRRRRSRSSGRCRPTTKCSSPAPAPASAPGSPCALRSAAIRTTARRRVTRRSRSPSSSSSAA